MKTEDIIQMLYDLDFESMRAGLDPEVEIKPLVWLKSMKSNYNTLKTADRVIRHQARLALAPYNVKLYETNNAITSYGIVKLLSNFTETSAYINLAEGTAQTLDRALESHLVKLIDELDFMPFHVAGLLLELFNIVNYGFGADRQPDIFWRETIAKTLYQAEVFAGVKSQDIRLAYTMTNGVTAAPNLSASQLIATINTVSTVNV